MLTKHSPLTVGMTRDKRRMRVVLDTSCARGTSREKLGILKERGFQIHISCLALFEFAVHFRNAASDQTPEQQKLRSRVKFIADMFGGAVPLAPIDAPLIDKLGGRMLRMGCVSYHPWLATCQTALERDCHRGCVADYL
jgi:hypothetical protein